MTMIIQAVEAEGRSVGRNFPAIEFAGKKSPDLAFSNVDRYVTRVRVEPRLCNRRRCKNDAFALSATLPTIKK